MAPPSAPEWVYDRQKLWNTVETAERRKDAQLARELEIALPMELQVHEQSELIREYVICEFVAHGMIADIAIHRVDVHNPHVHILLSTRVITASGFGIKERTWSELESLLAWRRDWAEIANAHLGKIGLAQRIDQRSLAAQGIDRKQGIKSGHGKFYPEITGI